MVVCIGVGAYVKLIDVNHTATTMVVCLEWIGFCLLNSYYAGSTPVTITKTNTLVRSINWNTTELDNLTTIHNKEYSTEYFG